MDWNDLKIFVVVCQEGSVSAAGQVLGLSHSTVGRRISVLEKELGVRLFDRTRDGYSMTQSAEEILGRALAIQEQTLAIHRETDGRDQELRGNVILTVPYDFAESVVIPSLGAFRERYPAIELELSTSLALVDLNARHADIALRVTEKPPESLIGRKLLPLRFGVYAHPNYLKKCRSPEIIGYRRDREVPQWARDNFPGARLTLRADTAMAIRSAIGHQLGIGRMPCFYGDEDPELVRLQIDAPESTWGIWVLHHADLRTTARVRACRDFLHEVVAANKSLIVGEDSRYARTPRRWCQEAQG